MQEAEATGNKIVDQLNALRKKMKEDLGGDEGAKAPS